VYSDSLGIHFGDILGHVQMEGGARTFTIALKNIKLETTQNTHHQGYWINEAVKINKL
jgi:hypothetical protein